jgi:hypothetical protein
MVDAAHKKKPVFVKYGFVHHVNPYLFGYFDS